MKQKIKITDLDTDVAVHVRESARPHVIAEYAEAIKEGQEFPPLGVVDDGHTFWVWDGFHTLKAYQEVKRKHAWCQVRKGTKQEAKLLAAKANATHGLRRSNMDKRAAIRSILAEAEWWGKSDRWIASECLTSNHLVSLVRDEMEREKSGKIPTDDGQRDTLQGGKIPTDDGQRDTLQGGKIPTFGWGEFEKKFGTVVRAVSDLAEMFGQVNDKGEVIGDKDYTEIGKLFNQLEKAVKSYYEKHKR